MLFSNKVLFSNKGSGFDAQNSYNVNGIYKRGNKEIVEKVRYVIPVLGGENRNMKVGVLLASHFSQSVKSKFSEILSKIKQ